MTDTAARWDCGDPDCPNRPTSDQPATAAPFRPKPGDTWVVGGKQYGVCVRCRRVVRLNKTLIGDIHVCEP